jgi:glycosyltransferase involved in cell wall biosynthesis
MRILHVHKYFHSRDGGSRYEQALMRLQEEAGHTVAPFAMHDSRNSPSPWGEFFVSNLDTRKASFGLGAFHQLFRALWSREAAQKFDRLLDAFRPDVIHVHNIYTQISPSVLAVAKRHGIPVVMSVHDYALVSANYSLWNKDRSMDLRHVGIWATARTKYIKGSFLATLLLELVLKFHHFIGAYDGAISRYLVSAHFMRDVLMRAGFDEKKFSMVGALAEPLMKESKDRGVVGMKSAKEKMVLFAGRLETYKGAQVLIESVKHLSKDIRIVIAGTGPDESRLKAMAGRDDRVTFLGFVPGDRLWEMMREAAVVVVPSVWAEVYGLVALEAMSQGTPVIVAKSGGLPEVVGDSKAGIVVPPGDAKALARAIERVLGDAGLAAAMGKAAYERAWEVGNPQAHLEEIMKVYSEVM